MAIGSRRDLGQQGWQSDRSLTPPLTEDCYRGTRPSPHICLHTVFLLRNPSQNSSFFESTWYTNKQMGDEECAVIVRGFSGIWTLWFLLYRIGFGCLFIIQCRLMNNFLGDWPTFLVPLASLAQQGSFRASSQHPVWEWLSFLHLLSPESLLKWPPAQEGPLSAVAPGTRKQLWFLGS